MVHSKYHAHANHQSFLGQPIYGNHSRQPQRRNDHVGWDGRSPATRTIESQVQKRIRRSTFDAHVWNDPRSDRGCLPRNEFRTATFYILSVLTLSLTYSAISISW